MAAAFRYRVESPGQAPARYLTSIGAAAELLRRGPGAAVRCPHGDRHLVTVARFDGCPPGESIHELAEALEAGRLALRAGDWRPCAGCCGELVQGFDAFCWRCRADVPAVPA